MPDILASTSTTATIGVGGVVTDMIEVREDHDWFRITLTAGQQITISMFGSGANPLEDTYLNIRSSSGTILAHDDDTGGTRNSKIVFTATTSGTYYIDAGAWDSSSADPWAPDLDPGYTGTGTYTLSVQPYTPPPSWNYDQIADQLVNGFWNVQNGEGPHHFNVSQGGTITVNYSTLTAAERNLASNALAEWSDIIGVTFTPVTTGGQIVFDNSDDPTTAGPDAFTEGHYTGGVYTSATVQISTSWVNNYGTGLNSYGFQTYLHEIGHALGLGHAGNYNSEADYAADALYREDAWSTSIMSYFSPTENSYFNAQGFTDYWTLTPMNGDIVAMQRMYGLSTTTRTDDTTYGFNSTAGRAVYNALTTPNVAYTIYDSGGIDTLDYSGFTQNQRIDLNAEAFSNVGAGVGNVVIARGVVVENAVGGSGIDTIIGNGAANRLVGNNGADTLSGGDGDDFLTGGAGADQLTGGFGNDTFIDARSSLSGDRITDFGAGDKIVFTDAALSSFAFTLSGTTLSFTGGSLTFGTALSGPLVASAAASGGVQLTLNQLVKPAIGQSGDFNGDGKTDVLWLSNSGTVTDWLGSTGGTLTGNWANAALSVPAGWTVAGVGDFNGDTRSDILWRNTAGTVTNWLGTSSGGFVGNLANASETVSSNWQIVATGDFNGDKKTDVLWRDANGTVTDWLGTASGGFVGNLANAHDALPNSWHVVGVGDFNGDHRDDILWRNDSGTITNWLGTVNGGFVGNWTNSNQNLPLSWQVAGIGDFNGDGISDVLWRDANGTIADWLGTSSGGFVGNYNNSAGILGSAWQVASTGDFNGDNRDDILWRDSAGHVTNWLGTSTGGFVDNSALAATYQATNWQIEPDFLH